MICNHYLGNYDNKITSKITDLIKASINIYDEVKQVLLPTPSKSHYLFNLRDISRVFSGLSYAKPQFVPEYDDLLRLWWHENRRVFEDRLTCQEDRTLIEGIIDKEMRGYMQRSQEEITNTESLIFTTILNEGKSSGYRQVSDMKQFVDRIKKYLE